MRHERALTLAVGLVLCVATRGATAAPASPIRAVQLNYQVASGCPGSLTFTSQVLARTTRLGFVEGAELELAVRVERDGTGFSGSVEAPWLAGSGTRLTAVTCDEVVAGLALAVALAVDAESARAPEIAVPPPEAPRNAPRAPSRPRRQWQWTLDVGVRSGLSRSLSPLIGTTVSWVAGDEHRSSVVPDFHLSLQAVWGGQFSKPGLHTRLAVLSAVLDVCPLRVQVTGRISGCLAAEGGALIAQLDPGDDLKSPLLSVGPAVRYQLHLGAFFVGVRGAGTVSVIREAYFYRPEARAYATPPLVFQCSTSLGYSFH